MTSSQTDKAYYTFAVAHFFGQTPMENDFAYIAGSRSKGPRVSSTEMVRVVVFPSFRTPLFIEARRDITIYEYEEDNYDDGTVKLIMPQEELIALVPFSEDRSAYVAAHVTFSDRDPNREAVSESVRKLANTDFRSLEKYTNKEQPCLDGTNIYIEVLSEGAIVFDEFHNCDPGFEAALASARPLFDLAAQSHPEIADRLKRYAAGDFDAFDDFELRE